MYRRRLASQNTLDSARLKKPLVKRPKLAESLQNGTSGYLKFLVMWLIVIALDLALDFRLEFLWPCWMFLKRIFESFKYKNCMQAFVLMGATFCSDYFIYAFIPSSWIFFVASTYVWTQQLFTPERGVGLPVLILWMVFVYIESCVRVTQPDDHWSRVMGSNCIGYPIVMLGFGFKSCLTLQWREKCRQLISYKNDFFYRLISTHAESQNLYHAPVRAFKRTNLLKLRYKMRYSGATFQAVEDVPLSEECVKNTQVNGLLSSMNDKSSSYDEIIAGCGAEEVSPLTGRSGNFNTRSTRTFLGHCVDPNEDFWTYEEESDSSVSTVPEPAPNPGKSGTTTTKEQPSNTGHKRSNNILSKMFDFQRDKPSAKVSPVMDKIQEPVKEARVSPIKKEKVVEDVSFKQVKADKKSKRNGHVKRQEFSNGHEDHHHTAVKIHLDKLKDIDDDLYFILQNHLDTCQNSLREEKLSRLRSEQLHETLEDELKKVQSDLQNSKNNEKSKDDKVHNLVNANKTLRSDYDKQRQELSKLHDTKPADTRDRAIGCDILPKEADHSKCKESVKSNETVISDLKKQIDNHTKNLKNEQNILKNIQAQDSETLLRAQRENEELRKQNTILTSRQESIIRNLRAETKVKMELFSALGDARRQAEELTHKLEQRCRENDMLKQRVAEAMAVSSFPTSSFSVPTTTTAADTFYSANGF